MAVNRYVHAMLMALLAGAAARADEAFKLEGAVGVGGAAVDTDAQTRDAAKLNEYRDLDSGARGEFNIKGWGGDYYLDAFGENLGRDDQFILIKGGEFGKFKYQLFDNRITHNQTFGALTPYAGVGTATLTATLPNLNPNTWGQFDYRLKLRDIGGLFEISSGSPWYVRTEANQVSTNGLKLISGANGSSPGNGFTDKPFPVDFTTRNFTVEGGYASRRGQLTLAVTNSAFRNDAELLQWQNAFFGGLDASTLPPDNKMTKISVNGNLRQLPWASTLAGRITYSKTTDNVALLTSMLAPGGAYVATNPDRAVFDGEIVHKTASLSWYANPTRALDTRLYWNHFEKDNRSPIIVFTQAPTSPLACGGASCITEKMGYDKKNVGAELGYRINGGNRLTVTLDNVQLHRDRVDFEATRDRRVALEYRNSALAEVSARFKYQHLQRRSDFLLGGAGVNGNDPEYLNRFVARFDASNVDQDLFKLQLDATLFDALDVSVEGIFKQNDYRDTVLGRTRDDREEYYLSIGYGDAQAWRIMAFGDVEYVRYRSLHRNISTVSSGSGVAPNDTPRGFCQSTVPDCYDPATAAGGSNYNWLAENKDRSYSAGVGADWAGSDRFALNASLLWQQTRGTVDFAIQSGATPAITPGPIEHYDNARKWSVNLKGDYKINASWSMAGGYAFERLRFDDIQIDGYRYVIGAGTGASYLSGAYAFPDYTAHIVYATVKYSF